MKSKSALLLSDQTIVTAAVTRLSGEETLPAQMLEMVYDPALTYDLHGCITFWNRSAEQIYGWSCEEAVGKIVYELLQTRYPHSRAQVRRSLATTGCWEGELIHTRRDGAQVVVASRQAMQRNMAGKPTVILEINHNITAQKEANQLDANAARSLNVIAELDVDHILSQTHEALMRTEKLRAVGELASGVAHNVNNVLTAVLGYAELIQGSDNVTPEINNYAHTIQRAALDGAEVVRRMQRFARKEVKTERELFALPETVREALELTRPAWHTLALGRGIHIETDVHLDTPLWVLGNASELREVFVNLITNAIHAMPEGGTLSVHSFTDNGQAVIEVGDTGIGMEEQVYKRIFEPFFTTKGPSLGTGLGLSVAWGILTQHQGRIDVQSAPGAGSVFRVSLPLATPPTSSAFPVPTSLSGNTENTNTKLSGVRVLLAEDDVLIQEGITLMLRGRGAEVTPTSSGMEALQTLAAKPSGFDLILSDHGMAGLTGLELLAQVRAQYPQLHRVLLSGWGANLPSEIDTSAAELVLAKPIHRDCLVTSLTSLLTTPSVEPHHSI